MAYHTMWYLFYERAPVLNLKARTRRSCSYPHIPVQYLARTRVFQILRNKCRRIEKVGKLEEGSENLISGTGDLYGVRRRRQDCKEA